MSKSLPAPVRLMLPRPSRDGRAAPGDQLAAQLRYRILTGDLRPGERLPRGRRPPVPRLPAFLRVTRTGGARVYQRLEAEAHLFPRGPRGPFARRASPL